ncbi:SGNH/GDSL hydrolase family protein [Trichocoleus sp. FACHB-591]|uniref:SGNH/GDSL hydrolase family protein n=1 Tax=Trichocoleus sp. FACHB-591 TaxID=2692872 RepID=UPI001684D5DC|nr:SGNH/GDSL hydrolase family protein [Trichocoleus sp. FACHB-591]MBD2095317.1 SGNH/GDSL hydrolase family protein [Trichocoleus sp. FACHB-591]
MRTVLTGISGAAIAIGSLTLISQPSTAATLSFNQVYFFGDSLSDPGNAYRASAGLVPPSPPYAQRFSNGSVWAEYLSVQLGLSPVPSTQLSAQNPPLQGANFAFGGATSGTANTVVPLFPALQQQIAQFLNLQAPANPNALFVLWAGANDYLPTESTFQPFTNPKPSVTNITTAVSALEAAGAQNILVVNLPDLGTLPLTRTTTDAPRLNALSKAHNNFLFRQMRRLERSPGFDANIIPLDINTLFQQVINQPSQFGLTNVTDSCFVQQPFSICSNPNEYLFWDRIHPTTAAHQLIGNFAFDNLVALFPPTTAAAFAAPESTSADLATSTFAALKSASASDSATLTALRSTSQASASVPEPTTAWGLLALAGLGISQVWRRREVLANGPASVVEAAETHTHLG